MITWQEKLNKERLLGNGWYGCIAPDGWKDIVIDADKQLNFIDPNYKIAQVKEKFGTLRYYFETEKTGIELDIMYAITDSAEQKSASICEECGKYAQLRTDKYYIRTLCNVCNDARDSLEFSNEQ